jgi:hypothetical protein
MKRKLESDGELDTEVNCRNADEFRDQLLEQGQDEFVRVIKCEYKSLAVDCCKFQYIYNSLYIVKQLYLYWIALSVLNCKAPKPSVTFAVLSARS